MHARQNSSGRQASYDSLRRPALHGQGISDPRHADRVQADRDPRNAGLRRDGLPGELSLPGCHAARVVAGKKYTEYMLLQKNDTVTFTATYCGPAGWRRRRIPPFCGASRQGGCVPVIRYTVQIYTTDGDRILGTQIECDRKDVPGRLADITMDYLGDVSYPDTCPGVVDAGRRFTIYMIHLKNNTVTVYRHVFNAADRDAGMTSATCVRIMQNAGKPFRVRAGENITSRRMILWCIKCRGIPQKEHALTGMSAGTCPGTRWCQATRGWKMRCGR